MTIIKIEHELTEEQKKKIMDAINTIVPDDMFCCPPKMIDDVIASKIWTEDDVKGAIEESGHELTEELLNQTLLNMEDMATLNDCQDYEWDFINGSIKEAHEEIIRRLGWTRFENGQYTKKLRDGVYKFVQNVNLPFDEHLVFINTIVIADWTDSDGVYNADCRSIIESYYGTVENFTSWYPDLDSRKQMLAKMIFENTASHSYEASETVTESEIQKTIDKFLRLYA